MHPDTRSEAEKAQPKLKEDIQRRDDILSSLDGTLGNVSMFYILLVVIWMCIISNNNENFKVKSWMGKSCISKFPK